ncbi:MAG: hypothetical protein RLZZ565_43 [Planctomycetota bacterium]
MASGADSGFGRRGVRRVRGSHDRRTELDELVLGKKEGADRVGAAIGALEGTRLGSTARRRRKCRAQPRGRTSREVAIGDASGRSRARSDVGEVTRTAVDFASMRTGSDSTLGRWCANLVGLACLSSMAWATRLRMRGAYWAWRRETAFGSDPKRWPDPAARRRAILEYARWVAAMRRLARR